MIKMHQPSQEHPASSETPNQDLKDIDVLCTFKIKIGSRSSEHGYIKDQWPYSNQGQDVKLQSRTSGILQSPKSGLKGHACSLHLQNQNKKHKFGAWEYQRPVAISKIKIKMLSPSQEHPASSKAPNEDLQNTDVLCNFKHKIECQKFGDGKFQRPVTISKSTSRF